MSPTLTEAEAAWLDSLRDGHGPTGDVDPHSVRELVRLAQRMTVLTDKEAARRERDHDLGIADALDKIADYYRTPPHKRDRSRGAEYGATVRRLVRELVNGWSL